MFSFFRADENENDFKRFSIYRDPQQLTRFCTALQSNVSQKLTICSLWRGGPSFVNIYQTECSRYNIVLAEFRIFQLIANGLPSFSQFLANSSANVWHIFYNHSSYVTGLTSFWTIWTLPNYWCWGSRSYLLIFDLWSLQTRFSAPQIAARCPSAAPTRWGGGTGGGAHAAAFTMKHERERE